MKNLSAKIWFFPLFYAMLAAVAGLLIRYAYAGYPLQVNLKFLLHAHSHVMLLGFLFNAFYLLIIKMFAIDIDRLSKRIFIFMQICVLFLFGAFIYQGYAFWSILFSTLHLWSSYILLYRLWKQMNKTGRPHMLVKTGIVFHFISSLGPYALGPLMVLGMKESPWYQQSVFFYLHFQFFGSFLLWFFALFLNRINFTISKQMHWLLVAAIVLLYAHPLDFSFNHPAIYFFGGLGAGMFMTLLLLLFKKVKDAVVSLKWLYAVLLIIGMGNILGSYPFFADLAIHSRFILIAWLHLIFLGLFTPAIWIFYGKTLNPVLVKIYAFLILISELFLVFPAASSNLTEIPVNGLLLFSYLGITLIFILIHAGWLIKIFRSDDLDVSKI